MFRDTASGVGCGIMGGECKPCQQYRKEMGEAMSQASFIKAAKIAMEAAKYAVTGKKKDDINAKPGAKTGE